MSFGKPTRNQDIGDRADAAATDYTSSWSVVALLKALLSWMGFAARSTAPATVANGVAVTGISDLMGRQIVQLGSIPELQYNAAQSVSNTTETNFAVGASGVRLGLHHLTIANRDTVAHEWLIRKSTGQATYDIVLRAAAGASVTWTCPQGVWASIAGNWSVQMSEAVTTTAPYLSAHLYRIASA